MKVCKKCNLEKKLIEFGKWKYGKDGYKLYCKECIRESGEYYRSKNRENLRLKSKEYNENNKDRIKEYQKSKSRKSQKKNWYENNKEKISSKNKINYELNKDEKKQSSREYREKVKNTESYKLSRREYSKIWRLNNKHIVYWRKIVKRVLNYIEKGKNSKTIEILGYSAIEFKFHIESLFIEGMSWENHGEWHIDHIIPVSKFDKNTPVNIINSLENLQPLWAKDNLLKGNRI